MQMKMIEFVDEKKKLEFDYQSKEANLVLQIKDLTNQNNSLSSQLKQIQQLINSTEQINKTTLERLT